MTSDTSSTSPTVSTQEPAAPASVGAGSSDSPASADKRLRVTSKQADARRKQVWQLRVVERKSYRDIADALKVSEHTVWQDMRRLAQQKKDPELAEKVLREHHTIYEALIDRWLPVALDRDTPEDASVETRLAFAEMSVTATDKVARLLSDQARLHGLGMPVQGKAGPSAAELGQEFGKRVVEAMLQLAHGKQHKEAAIEAELVTPVIEDAEQTNP